MAKKLTLKIVKERLKNINPNIEILSTEYVNSEGKLHCKCTVCNNEWYAKWSNLSHGTTCPECSIMNRDVKRRYTIEEIKNKLKEINKNIEILSDTYKNNYTNLHCKCKIDGYEWDACWHSIGRGTGCPMCATNFNLGISALHSYLRDKIKTWKEESIEYNNYKCDITGKRFDVIHHLYGFGNILKETMNKLNLPIHKQVNEYSDKELKNIENEFLKCHSKYGLGVCLCKEEHMLFHSIYRYGNNIPEQYYEFKVIRLNELNHPTP